MKIVLLSDIHSNSFYLSQLEENIKKEKADMIFFLGDAIGYYDNPNYVLDWLQKIDANCIKGNHEKYFLDEINYDKNQEKIYRVKENKKDITSSNRNFVKSWSDTLSMKIANKNFLFVHSDINSSEKHIYDVSSIDKELLIQYDFFIFGHTHIPLIQYHYGCCIINPGSIGQPRDYTQQSSYVVLNLNSLDITLKKTFVDVNSFCNSLNKKMYDKKVIDILKRKKNEKN
jgi:putative phosphoesterase